MTRALSAPFLRPAQAAAFLAAPLLILSLCACSGGGAARGGAQKKAGPEARAAAGTKEANRKNRSLGDDRKVAVADLTPVEREEITRAWQQFKTHSALWRISLHAIVERKGAGSYVLAENLFRHFFTASVYSNRAEIRRVAASVRVIGEPAVAYFAKPLVESLVPLGKPVVAEVTDPDKPDTKIKKTFHHFKIDDFTRRDAAWVLSQIGPPAVPTLSSDKLLRAAPPSGRRYAAMALGKIGDDAAVRALSRHLQTAQDWQDRAAAVKGLGEAMKRNPAARAALERASEDPDAFVRKKADEALSGRTKLPF